MAYLVPPHFPDDQDATTIMTASTTPLASRHKPARLAPEKANLTGIIAMLASMAAFVINDTCVKLASASMPIGEIIALRNAASTAYLLVFAAFLGGLTLPRNPPLKLLSLRMVGEIISTLLFLTALVTLPLADMTAIAQFTPLALTAAAAIFLGEHVSWRRWTATIVGLIGVGFIVRPGSTAFSIAGAMVLASIAFVVLRDLATRLISKDVPTLTLTLTSSASGIIAGLVLLPFETWHLPTVYEGMLVALAGLFLTFGYTLIIIALRTGDVGLVSPFRYAVILFALASSYLIWGHIPDEWALIGIVIVCAAGLYTVHRERVRLRTTPGSAD
jgi:drug/metabolite transporter (DMT)-like permease